MPGIVMSPAYSQPARHLARRIDAAHGLADDIASSVSVFHQRGRRQSAVLHVARQFDRVENLLIAGAAADIAAEPLLDLLAVGKRIGAQRRGRRHHHAGDAIAALAGAGLVEGLLQHAQFAGRGQRFDRLDRRALRLGDRHQAGFHQHAVDEHRAGAAFAGAAAFLVAGEVEIVAHEIEQPLMRLGAARDFAAVDGRFELKVRHRPPPAQARAPAGSAPARLRRVDQPAQHEAAHHLAAILLARARGDERHRHIGRLFQALGVERPAAQEVFDVAKPHGHRPDAGNGEAHVLECPALRRRA